MKPNLYLGRIFAFLIVLFNLCILGFTILGCGSGENTQASGGIGGTGVTVGMASDYGSIIVNDIEFDTRNADVFVEGQYSGTGDQAVLDNLPIGQTVVVQGSVEGEAGVADLVEAFYRVRGPLQSVSGNDEASVLTIMGQTVYVDQFTRWEGITLSSLNVGQLLQVSGLVDDQDAIVAGHVKLIDQETTPSSVVGLKGRVQSLDTSQKTFQINALSVDYSQAHDVLDDLTDDQEVAVHGLLVGDVLNAQAVLLFDGETFSSVENFSVEGFITDFVDFQQWRLGPYEVQFGQNTRLERMENEDLTEGIRVQVRGRLQNRTLHASIVAMGTRVRLESLLTIAAIDATNGLLTLDGMSAITIHTNDLTRIHGKAGSFAELQIGDKLRIHAHALNATEVVAQKISVTQAPGQMDRFLLEGPVTQISLPQIDILGVTVTTTVDLDFYDLDENQVTMPEFFAALTTDSLVRVTGTWVNGLLVYDSATILE